MSLRKTQLAALADDLQGPIDLLICSASFEERCLVVPYALPPDLVRNVLIAQNENHAGLHGPHPAMLARRFPHSAMVYLDSGNPLLTLDALAHALYNVSPNGLGRVLVDASTFTHEGLLILFYLLQNQFASADVCYAYSPAREYSLGEPVERKWLSRGLAGVRSVLGYSGFFYPSRKLHLIILMGYEHERAIELIRYFEPARLSLGFSGSSDLAAKADLQRYVRTRVREVFGNALEFSFPVTDPEGTRVELERHIASAADMNILIAPLSSKMSTIGAALTAFDYSAIQLCYPEAIAYNYRNYSQPGEDVYLFTREDESRPLGL